MKPSSGPSASIGGSMVTPAPVICCKRSDTDSQASGVTRSETSVQKPSGTG